MSTHALSSSGKGDLIIKSLVQIQEHLRNVTNAEVKKKMASRVQKWRSNNGIQTCIFKLGHQSFALFEDVTAKFKANSHPEFHNAVAQTVQNLSTQEWAQELSRGFSTILELSMIHQNGLHRNNNTSRAEGRGKDVSVMSCHFKKTLSSDCCKTRCNARWKFGTTTKFEQRRLF
jgi:hypothetical protein